MLTYNRILIFQGNLEQYKVRQFILKKMQQQNMKCKGRQKNIFTLFGVTGETLIFTG